MCFQYWKDLDNQVEVIMTGSGNPSAKADQIVDYLNNAYTKYDQWI